MSEISLLIRNIDLMDKDEPQKAEKIADIFFYELLAAERKHPNWPSDPIHAVAIMNEESGESTKASIDFYFKAQQFDLAKQSLITEVGQTGAMAIRTLLNLDTYKQINS